jgi:polyphosphate glucokinase
VVGQIIERLSAEKKLATDLPTGCGLPGVIKDGVVLTAANIDKAWIGLAADEAIGAAIGRRVSLLNDADAAGLAEMRLGAGRECAGTVIMLTVGTGIGSAIFVNHRLIPNTELGHIELAGRDAETRVSGAARERRRLRWKTWAAEFNEYLARVEGYFWPDLIILGGGVSKVMGKYRDYLRTRAPIVQAQYLNTSGIIGAAMYATEMRADQGK